MLDQRRFTAAGMSNNTQKLAAVNVQRHVLDGTALERRPGAVSMGQMINTNNGFQCMVSSFHQFC